METTADILNAFQAITLQEIDKAKLMDRTDTKFVFSIKDLYKVLNEIKENYKILEIKERRILTYRTLYYDTKDLRLYKTHHTGKLNRFKIRHRTYADSGASYLEVKFRNNKGRVIKERIKKQDVPLQLDSEAFGFIRTKAQLKSEVFFPSVAVNYKRITLVNNETAERVTIDTGLEFVKSDHTEKVNGLVIAEVKQNKKTASVFFDAMKKLRIRKISMSKYCMGVALTNRSVKKNNFKTNLISINKIVYAGNNLIASR